MTPWTFHSAGSLHVGRGTVARLPAIAAALGVRRIFIVTDEVLAKAGVVDAVVAPLQAANLAVQIFRGGQPEPAIEVIRAAVNAAREFEPAAVLGLGGGSNLDAAKLAALVLKQGGDATDYVGDCRVPGPTLPMIAVPTTAGTGSEVSAAAVFTDTAKKIKVSCLSPYLRPAVAVVDSTLTVSCPPKVTADSGIDALTHAIEAFTAVNHEEFVCRPGGETVYQGKNPLADAMAEQCIALVGKYLRRAVRDGNDLEARDHMALAGTLGGLAFANAGVALVHALEYPVGGAVHVSHGAGNGLLLPFVMQFNRPLREDAFRRIAEWLGGTDAIQEVEKLRSEIGIPTRLRDLGVSREQLPGFAEKAFAIKRLARVNPRTPTLEDLLGIYEAAF
jgi:alcohol dehydrogenase